MPYNPLDEQISRLLESKKKEFKYRQSDCILTSQHSISDFSTSEKLDFASNDYLNLRNNPEILEAGYEAAKKFGVGSGASRLVLNTNNILHKLEDYFSAQMGLNNAVFFPSGFVANVSFFDSISSLEDVEIFIDHRAHASLFFGLRSSKLSFQIFRHNDFEHLSLKLSRSQKTNKIVVVESIHSTDGTMLNANHLIQICIKHNALIFLDDTHGFGVLGNGTGFLNLYPNVRPFILAVSIGCGKAVGVSGGFLSSNHFLFKEFLIQTSKHLMFSTGISSFILGAVYKSLKIILSMEGQKRRNMLQTNLNFLKGMSLFKNNHHCLSTQIISIILGTNQKALLASNTLMEKGIIVKCLRPPSVPRNTSRLRVLLKSSHTQEDLETLCKALNEILH